MSAIAAFCALNCAVASMPADVVAQPQVIAKLPSDLEPQKMLEEPIFSGVPIESNNNESSQQSQVIAQIPSDLEPQEIPAEEPIFNGVQVEDRTNDSLQQFS